MRVLAATATAAAALVLAAAPAFATTGVNGGFDISWPQCSSSFPTKPVFGIVGVTDGRPDTTNGCFSAEYTWAAGATEALSIPPQLYVNTANPGPGDATWIGETGPKPCGHKEPAGCSYDYGYQAGEEAFAYASESDSSAAAQTWWLDVETANSWMHQSADNIEAIHGVIDGLAANDANAVGIYTNASSWRTITGGDTSDFSTRPVWFPTGLAWSNTTTPGHCGQAAVTGGTVTLVQYGTNQNGVSYDGDYKC